MTHHNDKNKADREASYEEKSTHSSYRTLELGKGVKKNANRHSNNQKENLDSH
jgi:hypothetical protein